jgi:hypothetical protein
MRAVIALLCLLFGGCVISSEYPDDWPKAGSSMFRDCPDISGRYEDIGQGSIDGEWSSLSTRFLGSEPDGEASVQIVQPDSELLVIKTISGGVESAVRSLHRSQNDFWCEDGMLWITDVDKSLRVWAVFKGRDNTGFSKGDDGSLIAEFDSKGGGLVLLIPVYGAVNSYFRWRAID